MTRRMRDESGFALMGAMLILIILMAIGLSLIALSDTQQRLSGTERVQESSFNLSEAALNAQALQIGRVWPTTATVTCDPTTSANTYCPQASAVGNGYTGGDYASSCQTAPATPMWKTQVRDNAAGEQFWTTTVNSRAAYDANADGTVWIRSFATVQCKTISTIALVSRSSAPLAIANNVITANWFATSNQGKKVIVDTLGTGSQPSKIVLRCNSAPSPCANYAANKGQVQPPTVTTSSTTSSQALTATQLQTLESQAATAGTLWPAGSCPTTTAQLTSPAGGAPVVVTGPCNVSVSGNGQINSSATPGVLVIENGTFTLGGTVNFYGLLYMVNKQASSGSVVNIQGNAQVNGIVNIDGNGGITAGSSKTNLVYDPRAAGLLRGSSGAAISRGTFRTLPPSTP